MRRASGKLELNSPKPEGESRTEEPVVFLQGGAEVSSASQPKRWSFPHVVEILPVLYALILTSLGIVLPLTLFLIPGLSYRLNGAYVTVFHYYVYLGSLVVLFYMILSGRRMARTSIVTHTTMGQVELPDGQEAPCLYEGIEEVNFFLRMGLVAFSMGFGLMEGFRIMSYVEEDSGRMWHCFGTAYLVLSVIRLFFLVIQTFVLFKYHRVVVNYHHGAMKFSTMHLLSANLCGWALTVSLEAVEAFNHAIALKSGHHKRSAEPEHHEVTNGTTTDSTSLPLCSRYPDTLSTLAAPYLFPFIIEYSLLAAAILYNMNGRIGPHEYKELQEIMDEKREEKKNLPKDAAEVNESLFPGTGCSKAHTGLFLGLLVFLIIGVATCFFLYLKAAAGHPTPVTGMIHISCDIAIGVITGLATVLAFWKTHKLFFTAHLHSQLDQNLLVIALFGYYILLVFMGIAALSQMSKPGLLGEGARLIGAMAIIDVIQITLQVLFIVDGLRRRAIDDRQAKDKPGRSVVTFLLICNLGLWLINTFMLKDSYAISIFSGYYGDLAWIIILNLTLPLAIYFRFHAAVCLSEIWQHAYSKSSMKKLLQDNMAHCGKIL